MLDLSARLTWLKNVIGDKNVVLGVSGGLDSAVCLAIVRQILPPERLNLFSLPYGEKSTFGAQKIIQSFDLNARLTTIDIAPLIEPLRRALQITESDFLRLGNLMARMRMTCLYDAAKKNKALVCGTSNKSEICLGYFTLWGDNASDFMPLADLTKTQVRGCAAQLGLPQEIIDQPPSADLWAGQTDEQELGFSYELADQVIEKLATGQTNHWSGEEQKVVDRIAAVKYKRQIPYQPQ